MKNKQMFNKREAFSIRKYSIGAASILVGSLLFLGGQASAAESNETQSSENVSTEQATQEKPSTESATQSVEQPKTNEVATQEVKTTEVPSTEEVKTQEAQVQSNEAIHNDAQSNQASQQANTKEVSSEVSSTQEDKDTNEAPHTQEQPSTEQAPQESETNDKNSTSTKEVKTEEAPTEEVYSSQDKTTQSTTEQLTKESSQTQEQAQHESKQETSTEESKESTTQETTKTTQPSTEKIETGHDKTAPKSNESSDSTVVQDKNVGSTQEGRESTQPSNTNRPFQEEVKNNEVTSTEEGNVTIAEVPETEIKDLTPKEKEELFKVLQEDANTQDQQPKAILSTTPEWTSAQRTKNASRTGQDQLNVTHSGRYTSGADFGKGGTEIVKYNPKNGYAYSVNGDKEALDIIDVKHPGKEGAINLVKRIYLQDNGIEAGDVTSVTVHPSGDYVAVSAPAEDKTQPGHVAFYSADGQYLNHLTVGSLPDMVTFSKDGKYLLVANEGEPNDDYTVNPQGSVSVINLSAGPSHLTAENVRTAVFTKEHQQGLRALGPNAEDAYLNIEPEYIAVDNQSKYAYVTLQEVSAIAKIDIEKAQIVDVKALPYKDYSLAQNSMDPSDKDDKKELRRVPVLGLLQPDGIDTYEYNGETYLVIANEGDSQDYKGYSEETRVKKLKDDIQLDARYYKGFTQAELDEMVKNGLFDDEQLGRLKVTTAQPFKTEDGKYNALVTYSGRSFSILRASDLEMIYDSGNDIEQRVLDLLPERFNANYEGPDEIEVDGRSDDKGPEVENVVVGKVGAHSYAFVGLERVGGVMIYDITNPNEPYFVKYLYDPDNKDISPEGITFESAEESPTGKPMLIASFELSGTTSTWELDDLTGDVEDDNNPGNTNGESKDDPDNPLSENEEPNTDHDVDNGEHQDNEDETSDNEEDNHSSESNNGTDEGLEPLYEVDGDIFGDDSDEVISDQADNNDGDTTNHEEGTLENEESNQPANQNNENETHNDNPMLTQGVDVTHHNSSSQNVNHKAHSNHQQDVSHNRQSTAPNHHTVENNHSNTVASNVKHSQHSNGKTIKELPKSGQTGANTTLWSILLGGLGLAFIRKHKPSKTEK
ncbi:choice-of-anchor I family protein [Staphylococcus sp. NRL 16/872]|uniref:choice-of-anchor I family protein n=1 Tax=Staphylococcus sp. NRL 16/872 TaxID=2930131 RepID=UPI001FB3E6D1|nr:MULTISPECIES: choice-of-anchor I family protein [unclassified Staphylococcus]MCJ1655335.1 choice-of-anchor I family protein [Staphylococcus sp. NRL 21/187]MCJ1667063.1 choice-of-anchor I family protein [Staphylococcus sp. NRL 19/737]WEN69538.1 choice-of-anchor I family protein [Staphylococcus sp. NRL 16/872]